MSASAVGCALVALLCGEVASPSLVVRERLRDLESPVPAVRARAAEALGTSGPGAVPELLGVLRDRDVSVRTKAARSLGMLRDASAVEGLITALGDPAVDVRYHAAHSLGCLGDRASVEALVRALCDADYGVRDQAAGALRAIGDPGMVPALMRLFVRTEMDPRHVVWLLQGSVGASSVAPLARILEQDEPVIRRRAVKALAALADTGEVTAHLCRATGDPDVAVRRCAILALRTVREPEVVTAFTEQLEREDDETLRKRLARALDELSRDPRLDACWSFDDGNAGVARDDTGHGTDGAIMGCPVVPGKVGRALAFGPGHYVELGRPSGLKISGRPMTIMAWVHADADEGVVVARGGAFCGFSLYLMKGMPKFGIHREQLGPGFIAAGREGVVGRWVHLAGVIDKDRIVLFVDGHAVATTAIPGYLPSECGQGMEIGFDVGNSPAETTTAFRGRIDEVKAFNVALDEDEIRAAMKAEK